MAEPGAGPGFLMAYFLPIGSEYKNTVKLSSSSLRAR